MLLSNLLDALLMIYNKLPLAVYFILKSKEKQNENNEIGNNTI